MCKGGLALQGFPLVVWRGEPKKSCGLPGGVPIRSKVEFGASHIAAQSPLKEEYWGWGGNVSRTDQQCQRLAQPTAKKTTTR